MQCTLDRKLTSSRREWWETKNSSLCPDVGETAQILIVQCVFSHSLRLFYNLETTRTVFVFLWGVLEQYWMCTDCLGTCSGTVFFARRSAPILKFYGVLFGCLESSFNENTKVNSAIFSLPRLEQNWLYTECFPNLSYCSAYYEHSTTILPS
jgi:hypothetical protein